MYSSSSVLGEMDLAKLLLVLLKQIWQTAIGSPQTGSCQQAPLYPRLGKNSTNKTHSYVCRSTTEWTY